MHFWQTGVTYRVGENAMWNGIRLVCCREHVVGDQAKHPWDPGVGWPEPHAAALWAPDGDVEAAKLHKQSLVWSGRLKVVAQLAANGPGGGLEAA